jgi:hypothetical protein
MAETPQEYWKNKMKPWIMQHIGHFGFDPSKGFEEIFEQAEKIYFEKGYAATVQFVQSFKREQLLKIVESKKTGVAMIGVGAAALLGAFFILRKK